MNTLCVVRVCTRVCAYLVSKKGGNQGAIDVTEDEPDQNHNQVLHKCCGVCISDEHELIQHKREPKRGKKKTTFTYNKSLFILNLSLYFC